MESIVESQTMGSVSIHNFNKKSGLHYEIGIGMTQGNIVWPMDFPLWLLAGHLYCLQLSPNISQTQQAYISHWSIKSTIEKFPMQNRVCSNHETANLVTSHSWFLSIGTAIQLKLMVLFLCYCYASFWVLEMAILSSKVILESNELLQYLLFLKFRHTQNIHVSESNHQL